MLRHDVQPGRLVAGIFLTTTGVVFAGDAAGAWRIPWFVVVPLVVGGLSLAAAVGVLHRGRRRRRAVRAPAGTPGRTRTG
ncbi:hypothetical protein [Streptomyces tropicalis]|uniref:Integral membrane protein n=1 Tax=Streptomyces tropicalis TaxID=3034234 RepID=A0ABT6A8U7_9ACTN|nr:hypothetical protein [Streptomyces tropicalis]MDF3301080.1 hypothetical protein [Streptomyces tropicalis]